MKLRITKLDVWAAEIDDQPGGLARELRALAGRGADLECVLARRESGKPGKGVVFVAPRQGKEQLEGAGDLGLHRSTRLATLRIEGPDRAGMGADIAAAIAEAGVNLHGLTATAIDRQFLCFASFDSVADMERAEDALTALSAQMHRSWHDWLTRGRTEKSKVPA